MLVCIEKRSKPNSLLKELIKAKNETASDLKKQYSGKSQIWINPANIGQILG